MPKKKTTKKVTKKVEKTKKFPEKLVQGHNSVKHLVGNAVQKTYRDMETAKRETGLE